MPVILLPAFAMICGFATSAAHAVLSGGSGLLAGLVIYAAASFLSAAVGAVALYLRHASRFASHGGGRALPERGVVATAVAEIAGPRAVR